MQRSGENLVTTMQRELSASPGLFRHMPFDFSLAKLGSAMSVRRIAVAPSQMFVMAFVILAAVACAPGTGISPAGAQDPSDSTGITVPDDISGLDSEEVERRLGRLLNDDVPTGQSAPDVEPTSTIDEPTLEEILALLNSATPVPATDPVTGEIVISVSPGTLAALDRPVLTIKSPPSHGSVTVISPNQILYMPDGSGDGSDSFEYELFDGDRSVVSQVMEIRR